MKKIVIALLVLSVLFILYAFYQGLKTPQVQVLQSTLIGKSAPAFSKTSLIKKQIFNSTEFFQNNNYTLLNIFASWCIPCRIEHKFLMKLKRSGGLKIVGLNYKDEKQKALAFLKELGNPYDFVIADDGKIGFKYGVYGVPESFLIDKNGIIRYKVVGGLSEKIIKNKILPFIDASNNL